EAGLPRHIRTSSPNRNCRIMAAISMRVRGRGDRDIIAGAGGIRQQEDKLLWQTSRGESILRSEVEGSEREAHGYKAAQHVDDGPRPARPARCAGRSPIHPPPIGTR